MRIIEIAVFVFILNLTAAWLNSSNLFASGNFYATKIQPSDICNPDAPTYDTYKCSTWLQNQAGYNPSGVPQSLWSQWANFIFGDFPSAVTKLLNIFTSATTFPAVFAYNLVCPNTTYGAAVQSVGLNSGCAADPTWFGFCSMIAGIIWIIYIVGLIQIIGNRPFKMMD